MPDYEKLYHEMLEANRKAQQALQMLQTMNEQLASYTIADLEHTRLCCENEEMVDCD